MYPRSNYFKILCK